MEALSLSLSFREFIAKLLGIRIVRLVGWLILNVPVNNLSVMLGRSQRFLGNTSTFGE